MKQKIINYYTEYYKNILNIPNWKTLVKNRLIEEKEELKRIAYLEKALGSFKNKKILDIGCGTGGFLKAAQEKRACAYGIEPDKKAFEICRLKKLNVLNCFAEKLPFKKESFDIIHCHTVIEHVANIEKSILEMVRVAKKGGRVYIKCPNYLSFYEGHYKIFWLPLFPKKLAKIYLKLRKRPAGFIDSINYTTPGIFIKIFKKYRFKYKFINQNTQRHKGLLNLLIYIYQKIFNVSQNIEVIIYVG